MDLSAEVGHRALRSRLERQRRDGGGCLVLVRKADEDVGVIPALDADDQSAPAGGERSSVGWQRWARAALVAVVLLLIWEVRRWSWGDGDDIQLYVVVPLLEVMLGVLSRSVLALAWQQLSAIAVVAGVVMGVSIYTVTAGVADHPPLSPWIHGGIDFLFVAVPFLVGALLGRVIHTAASGTPPHSG